MKLYRQSGYLLPNLSRGAPVSLSCTAPQTQLWFPHIPRLENLLMDHWCTEKTELANTGQKESKWTISTLFIENIILKSDDDSPIPLRRPIWDEFLDLCNKMRNWPLWICQQVVYTHLKRRSNLSKHKKFYPSSSLKWWTVLCVCASSFGKFVGENLHKRWRFPNFETTPQLKLRHSAKIYPQRKQTENIGLPSRNQHDQLHDLLNISLKSRWFSHEHLHFGMSGRYDPRALGNAAGYPMFIRWISMVLMNSQLLLNMVNKSNFCLLKPRDFLGKVPLCHLLSMFICWNHSWTALFLFYPCQIHPFHPQFFCGLEADRWNGWRSPTHLKASRLRKWMMNCWCA